MPWLLVIDVFQERDKASLQAEDLLKGRFALEILSEDVLRDT